MVSADDFEAFTEWLDRMGSFTVSFRTAGGTWTDEETVPQWAAHDGRLAFMPIGSGRHHTIVPDSLVLDGETWAAEVGGRSFLIGYTWTDAQERALAEWRARPPDELAAVASLLDAAAQDAP